MGKMKIKTTATEGGLRFSDDASSFGAIEQAPTDEGNEFDVRIGDEPDGVVAAKKIVSVLKRRGVCVVEPNAPDDLISAAYEEAEALAGGNEFGPPFKVHDDSSMLEAKLWDSALGDEHKAHLLKEDKGAFAQSKAALKILAKNIADFGSGLGDYLGREMGLRYDRHADTMLCYYSGDRQYHLHIDNPHLCDPSSRRPDSGMRLSAAYYINPHWDPESDMDCGGGLDVHLTDPKKVSSSASAARSAPRLRVAPHADTLVLMLSERTAHQVVQTKNAERWYCLRMWFMNGAIMEDVPRKMQELRAKATGEDSDDEP